MGLKSDKWIRQMAREHGMIQPFHEHQMRCKERDPSKEEMGVVRVMQNDKCAALAALQAMNPQIQDVRNDPLLGIQILERIVSFGTSSYGYDIRCADEFKVFTNINTTVVDPKNFDPKSFVDVKGDKCIIPPNSFALARTVEYLKIPKNVLTVCLGKSTYARCGIIVNVTPFEPGWEGYVTLEFSNTTPLPAVIYANEGCAQVLFFEGDEQCETAYSDRNGGAGGKYQGQSGVVVPRM